MPGTNWIATTAHRGGYLDPDSGVFVWWTCATCGLDLDVLVEIHNQVDDGRTCNELTPAERAAFFAVVKCANNHLWKYTCSGFEAYVP